MAPPSLTMLETVEFLGFYLPPFLIWAGLAVLPFIILRWLFGKVRFYRFVWHRSLFNLALYVMLMGSVVFLGNLAWP
jgi:hypothetical protein